MRQKERRAMAKLSTLFVALAVSVPITQGVGAAEARAEDARSPARDAVLDDRRVEISLETSTPRVSHRIEVSDTRGFTRVLKGRTFGACRKTPCVRSFTWDQVDWGGTGYWRVGVRSKVGGKWDFGSVWSYSIVDLPSPADGVELEATSSPVTLRWMKRQAKPKTQTYKVLLTTRAGDITKKGLSRLGKTVTCTGSEKTASCKYDYPIQLKPGKRYYWGVGVANADGAASPEIRQSFTTRPQLTFVKSGQGRVVSRPALACRRVKSRTVCQGTFKTGTDVTVMVTPASGWKVTNTGGDCALVGGDRSKLRVKVSGNKRCRVWLKPAPKAK
jgi:hypothetical protein